MNMWNNWIGGWLESSTQQSSNCLLMRTTDGKNMSDMLDVVPRLMLAVMFLEYMQLLASFRSLAQNQDLKFLWYDWTSLQMESVVETITTRMWKFQIHSFLLNSTEICPSQQLIIFWPRPHWTLWKPEDCKTFMYLSRSGGKQTWNCVWQETVTIKICRQVTSTWKTYCWAFQYIDESVCTITLLCSLFAEWSESWSPLHRLLSHSVPHQLYSGPCNLLTVRRNELLSLKLCCQQLAVEQIKRPTPKQQIFSHDELSSSTMQ